MENEPTLSSDDSSDSELKNMKNQLVEYGLGEENLTKEEMNDLLKALNNSKTSAKEDELLRQKIELKPCNVPTKNAMKRRYLDVRDLRMPWSVLPDTITQAEKARTLAVYIKLMSINNYRQARLSATFASWPPSIQIVEETNRVQPLRSTRSGRSMPMYAGFDDDSSDFDLDITKSKKRKISNIDMNGDDGVYSNKVVSLKRKSPKRESLWSLAKGSKLDIECTDIESFALGNNLKPKKSIFTIIED